MTKVNHQKVHTDKIIVLGLFGAVLLLFALYMYFVSASVLHVVMRKETDQELSSLHSKISQLEGAYIESQHRVSSDIASLQGFTQNGKKVFIDRTAPSLVLSTASGR